MTHRGRHVVTPQEKHLSARQVTLSKYINRFGLTWTSTEVICQFLNPSGKKKKIELKFYFISDM